MPFTYTLEVRWRDCDSYRHVNNAVYLTYFEEARAHFWRALRADAFTGYDFIIAEITCTYRSPAEEGEILTVAIRVSEIGTKSFHLAYRITENATGREVATGRSVQVMYDHDRKVSFAVDEALRAQLQAAMA
jgi:acyl-CoA thioester hydrolase